MPTTMQSHSRKKPSASLASGLRPVPKWQVERARRLHRKFLSLERAIARGERFKKATKAFVWYWRRRNYQNDPGRRVRFSRVTLYHLFRQWRDGGRTPAALKLNYRGLVPSVSAPLLVRFVEFCSTLQFRHMKEAWAEFSRRKGSFGRGAPGRRPIAVTYAQLQYFFNGKKFARLQAAQRAIDRAEKHLANLRWDYMGQIQQRLPARPRRRTPAELSLAAASL